MHWRLYPAIYALPLLRFIALRRRQQCPPCRPGPLASVAELASPPAFAFAAAATGVFALLGGGCYLMYGQPFLHETYLYHASRTDPRHNFSPYFYPAYLALGAQAGAPAASDGAW